MDLFKYKIVPVVVLNDVADAEPLGRALIEGGLPIAEITFRTPVAAQCIEIMSEMEGLLVGAGTVVTPAQVELAIEAGADFLVSPGLRSDVAREAQLAGKMILPGAVTPSEIMTALNLGIETVKFFPANIYGGPAALKALAAPFTTVQFVPTGGVSPTNIREYLALPFVPAVGGSWMVPSDLIAAHEFSAIATLCHEAVALAASFS
ncbi:MAG: bifunctional 4-hydroxy-2-oxoglutarate aldolase/2-dehydro-3-deoxy-phosphogluconate aldolase [Propionibacteriaceae bacterium]|nr:bifunctional 4-hydroxy-2-oxoglutarate aldolase/2-dehydro-3-deoxy-phosphogluconate aldolase [Propionibacteriaceae bacterium]